MDRVGVIGLGKMGLPIAMNLMSRGFHVTGYRRSGSPELVQAGGTMAASAAEVAAQADVILSIVPTAEDVEEIIQGPQGTLSTLREGTIHIEMSTIDVDRKARLRDQVRAQGGDLLDCPITRQPRHGRAPAGHHVRIGRPDQRQQGQRGARRHLRSVGLHRRRSAPGPR